MSSVAKSLAKLIQNPRNDWTISELCSIAGHYGISFRFSGNSHCQFSSESGEHVMQVSANSGRMVPYTYIPDFCRFLFAASPEAIEDCRKALSHDKPGQQKLEGLLSNGRGNGLH